MLRKSGSWPPRDSAESRVAAELQGKPSIAVLQFQNMSGDPAQDYFADGMVEEIITALSRIRWLRVLSTNSSFSFKGQAIQGHSIQDLRCKKRDELERGIG